MGAVGGADAPRWQPRGGGDPSGGARGDRGGWNGHFGGGQPPVNSPPTAVAPADGPRWQGRGGNGDGRGEGWRGVQPSGGQTADPRGDRRRWEQPRDPSIMVGRGGGDVRRDSRWNGVDVHRDGRRNGDNRDGWRDNNPNPGIGGNDRNPNPGIGGNDRDRRFAGNDQFRRWDNDWRRDRRYDWRSYREQNRFAFRIGSYFDPFGYGYRSLRPGITLYAGYYQPDYWLDDPSQFRLPPIYGPYRWVRYFNDAVLVDIYDGQVVDVIRDFFW